MAIVIATIVGPIASAPSGRVANGAGLTSHSLEGAETAAGHDASGSLHSNPAGIGLLDRSSLDLSLEFFRPRSSIASGVRAGAFGPFGPAATQVGSTRSRETLYTIPGLAGVYRLEETPWTFGLSAFGVGGFGVDYRSEPDNPITTAQPPGGLGFGAIESNYEHLQVVPAVAYRVNDRLSIGLAPIFNRATLEVDPFPAAAPDDANRDGFATFPNVSQATASGYGFHLGVQLRLDHGLSLGAAVRSPQWLESFRFRAIDELGRRRRIRFDLDHPMIVSAGIGYRGLDRWDSGVDLRYIHYRNSDGFGPTGFDATGAVEGFGWQSIFVVAVGAQLRATDSLLLRAGYSFNQNPIRGVDTFFNVASPAIVQHHLSAGFSLAITASASIGASYHHGFENSIRGPWHDARGPIDGTFVRSTLSTDAWVIGPTISF